MSRVTPLLLLLTMFALSTQANAQDPQKSKTGGNMKKAQSSFKIESWEETAFSEVEEGGKLTRASVTKSYSGDINGKGVLEYLMRYHDDGSADFFGLERVTGHIENRSGSFVLRHEGTFEGGEMTQRSVVIEGSGTGELTGLQGEISHSAGHQEEYPFMFLYALE